MKADHASITCGKEKIVISDRCQGTYYGGCFGFNMQIFRFSQSGLLYNSSVQKEVS